MTNELKACPFCGGEAKLILSSRPWIECSACKTGFRHGEGKTDNYGESVTSWWNTRHDPYKRDTVEPFETPLTHPENVLKKPEKSNASETTLSPAHLAALGQMLNLE